MKVQTSNTVGQVNQDAVADGRKLLGFARGLIEISQSPEGLREAAKKIRSIANDLDELAEIKEML